MYLHFLFTQIFFSIFAYDGCWFMTKLPATECLETGIGTSACIEYLYIFMTRHITFLCFCMHLLRTLLCFAVSVFFHTLVAIFQIRCCISKNCTVRAMGFALCRVYLRNPLDPPDISGFGRDHLDSNKDKRKCMLFDD